MPSVGRACFPILLLSLLIQIPAAASAAQASRQTINQVSQLIVNSYDLLNRSDAEGARRECAKALALEEKYSDPFIAATVHVCFGDVDDHESKTASACQHYNQALRKLQATPKQHPAQRVLPTQINVVEGKIFALSCAAGSADKK